MKSDIGPIPNDLKKNPEACRLIKIIEQEKDRSPAWVFLLTQDPRIPTRLLDLLSAEFGENSEFATFPKSPGWPTNNSIIFERPLVRHAGDYYRFLPHLLVQRLDSIGEAMVRAEDESYFQKTFEKQRSSYLESASLRYLVHMLPGCRVFPNVFYDITEEGVQKRPETDAIVIFDQTLFIVEAKSGGVSLAARRGGVDSIKSTVKGKR